jgi:hypothetical protein
MTMGKNAGKERWRGYDLASPVARYPKTNFVFWFLILISVTPTAKCFLSLDHHGTS